MKKLFHLVVAIWLTVALTASSYDSGLHLLFFAQVAYAESANQNDDSSMPIDGENIAFSPLAVKDIPDGISSYIWEDTGVTYEGEWLNGLVHGQ